MEKIWKLLSNFEAIESGFWKEFESIKDSLNYIKDLVEVQNEKIERIEKTMVCLQGQVELQQFSTPPILAWLMAKAASLRSPDHILEPSAGNGALALWGDVRDCYMTLIRPAPW